MTLVIGILIPFLAINSGLMIKFSAIFTKIKRLSFYSSTGIFAEEAISSIRVAVAFGVQKKLFNLYDAHLDEAKKEGLASGASAKIFETIDRIPSINITSDTGDKPENVIGHIQLKNINFIYQTRLNVKALNNISFGSSGSGKSTIVSLILRFYDSLSGDIFLDGRNIKSLNLTWLRSQINRLIGSIYENLTDNEKRERIEIVCKIADANDFIMKFPGKYETMVGERGILLSGGQKQRKTSKGRTTIVVAHRLSTIRNVAKIIVMNKGVIIESGTHKELMDKKGDYFKIVETQKIQLTLKTGEEFKKLNSLITSPNDEIITENNDRAYYHSNLSEQKADVEI
ncbi:multidrug resistance protein MDR [Gigaspora margarita]|uniref:Multidrug resistance protein MDR n=1 Tax=Gigaspora margarita TaxID=4874 RepID=A0A8H4EG39_GIGMA|nr:multidrug resistance protein MDR [Gigaspora margarita]